MAALPFGDIAGSECRSKVPTNRNLNFALSAANVANKGLPEPQIQIVPIWAIARPTVMRIDEKIGETPAAHQKTSAVPVQHQNRWIAVVHSSYCSLPQASISNRRPKSSEVIKIRYSIHKLVVPRGWGQSLHAGIPPLHPVQKLKQSAVSKAGTVASSPDDLQLKGLPFRRNSCG